MECIICKNKMFLPAKKITEGGICKKCSDSLTDFVNLKYITKEDAEKIIEYNQKLNFDCTSNLGTLGIDSYNYTFCIEKQKNKFNNVFSITDLTEVGLFCDNARASGRYGTDVYVDFAFRFVAKINNIQIDQKEIIKRNVLCDYKQIGNEAEITIPNILIMFKEMFNQMVEDKNKEIDKKIAGLKRVAINEREIIKSEGILFLDDDYNKEDIKKHRNILLKALHSDNSNIDDIYAVKINKAYELLKPK